MKTRIEVKAWAIVNLNTGTIEKISYPNQPRRPANKYQEVEVPLTGFYEVEREPLRSEWEVTVGKHCEQTIYMDPKFAGKKVTIVVTEME